MRRTKLLWFAIGAGTSGILSLAAYWFFEPTVIGHSSVTYFVLTDRSPQATRFPEADADVRTAIADKAGEVLRSCGARVFEMSSSYNSRPPTADLPIVDENFPAIKCVIEEGSKKGIDFRMESRWSSPATNELRSKR